MPGYKNFAAGAVLGESDLDDYLMEQTVMVFANEAARDAALTTAKQHGTLTFQQDTEKYTAYDGSGDWWTVGQAAGFGGMIVGSLALVQSGAVTHGVHHVEQTIVNGMCDLWFRITASSAGTAGAAVYINMGLAAAADLHVIGEGYISDASTGFHYTGIWEIVTGFPGRISLIPAGTSINNYWGITPSIALASGDTIAGHVRFQVDLAG